LNLEQRLAAIVAALESVGLCCLVLGGHAVRFYGLRRHTNDFDLTLAPDGWDDLADRLARTGLFAGAGPVEGHTAKRKALEACEVDRSAHPDPIWKSQVDRITWN
jgi:hypothetical protein